MKKLLKIDSSILRILAIIFMTIDHVGVFLDFSNFYILRIIGRLALPLFAFLTVEGALKTSNKKNYFLRVTGLFFLVGIVITIFSFLGGKYEELAFTGGNIFFDLLLIILSVYILESPNKKIKPLIALPILYSIFSSIVVKLEGCGCDGLYWWLFPPFRLQYGFYAVFLGLGFYLSKKLSPIFVRKHAPMFMDDPDYGQLVSNIMSVLVLVFITIILMLSNMAFGNKYANMLDGIQTYAIISGLIIIFYSGKKGYSSKWFKVAYYLYYPLHIAIIGLIFYLI